MMYTVQLQLSIRGRKLSVLHPSIRGRECVLFSGGKKRRSRLKECLKEALCMSHKWQQAPYFQHLLSLELPNVLSELCLVHWGLCCGVVPHSCQDKSAGEACGAKRDVSCIWLASVRSIPLSLLISSAFKVALRVDLRQEDRQCQSIFIGWMIQSVCLTRYVRTYRAKKEYIRDLATSRSRVIRR